MLEVANKSHDASSLRIGDGLRASIAGVGFGGAPIGNLHRAISDRDAIETVCAAWAHGLRHFDTAPLYGHGLSETRLGTALTGEQRDSFILSSKVGRVLEASVSTARDSGAYVDVAPFAIRRDYGRDAVLRSVEGSLQRLRVDRIDILYVHDLEPASFESSDIYESHFAALANCGWRALADLRAAGVVRAIGAGVNQVAACERMMAEFDPDIFLLAGRYTLLDQSASTLIDACSARGIAVVAGGVFNSGVLARGPEASYDYAVAPDEVRRRVVAMQATCASHNIPLAAAALAFASRDSRIASVLVGAQTVGEVEANATLAQIAVPDVLLDELVALSRTAPC